MTIFATSIAVFASLAMTGGSKLSLPANQSWNVSDFPGLDCSKSIKPDEVEIGQSALADLNRDGTTEIFIAVRCVASTSSWPSSLYLFQNTKLAQTPVFVSRLLDEKSGYQNRPLLISDKSKDAIVIHGKTVTISSQSWSEQDPNCCPSVKLVDTFKWKGENIVKVKRLIEKEDEGGL